VLALTLVQAVSGGLGVLYALLLRNIVDSAVGHDVGAFRHNVVLIIALVVLQISLSAIVRWLNELARSDIENRFKQRLTDNILRKEYSAVSATHTAEWLNRLTNDTTVVANGIVEILPGLTGTIVRLVSAVIMVIALDRMFAAILVPGGVVLCVLAYVFRKTLKRLHKNIQESDGRLRVFLQEHIGSLMMIKSFMAEDQTSREATKAMNDHKAARMRRNRFSNVANVGFAVAMQGMYLLGVVYCAYGILRDTVSYGTLTAVMQLIGQIQGPFVNISGYLPRYYAMTASAERLMEIEAFADDETARDADDVYDYYLESFTALGLRDASFTYESGDGSPVVLKGETAEEEAPVAAAEPAPESSASEEEACDEYDPDCEEEDDEEFVYKTTAPVDNSSADQRDYAADDAANDVGDRFGIADEVRFWTAVGLSALAVTAAVLGIVNHSKSNEAKDAYDELNDLNSSILEACGGKPQCEEIMTAKVKTEDWNMADLERRIAENKDTQDSYATARNIWFGVSAAAITGAVVLFVW